MMADDRPRRGRTLIEARALRHLAAHLGADAAEVPVGDVIVDLEDDAGRLRADVTLPLVVNRAAPKTVGAQAEAVRSGIARGMSAMSGRHTHSVNVRFSGVHEPTRGGRVR